MSPLNIAKIEQEARRLRAAEMQRIEGLMLARLGLYFRLLAGSILSAVAVLTESVRPLFSWNPQTAASPVKGPSLLTRLSLAGRALFSWNPQANRS